LQVRSNPSRPIENCLQMREIVSREIGTNDREVNIRLLTHPSRAEKARANANESER